ncbi:MAG: hypothetical protein KGR26_01205 [Cyanobacteria bacterium REEB65]|nr:hypothetical protein [Cyanobacteria bacterium REEB65]
MTAFETDSLVIQAATLAIYLTTLATVVASAVVAFGQYRSTREQTRYETTVSSIASFLEGPWLLEEDRKNWNALMEAMTGEVMRFDGMFNATKLSSGVSPVPTPLNELFTEGPYVNFGEAVINVLAVLDHIARGLLRGTLDKDLAWLRLGRFFQIGDYLSSQIQTTDGTMFGKHVRAVWRNARSSARYQGRWLFPRKYRRIDRSYSGAKWE